MAALRPLDFGVLLACAAGIMLAMQNEGVTGFVKIWHHPIDITSYQNGVFPTPAERVDPIIRDLDGDGRPEVILATREPSLRVLKLRVHDSVEEDSDTAQTSKDLSKKNTKSGDKSAGKSRFDTVSFVDTNWADVRLEAESPILPKLKMRTGRQALALDSGYIHKYDKDKNRKQVIIVVTEGCKVLCYTSELELMWDRTINCDLSEQYLSEVSILVTSQSIMESDTGLVIVGGRLYPKDHHHKQKKDKSDIDDEDLDAEDDINSLEETAEDIISKTKEKLKSIGQDAGHYSFYAFEGKTGQERWSHLAGDFIPEVDPAENLTPILEIHEHSGELSWKDFRSSFISNLPHAWFRQEDTKLALAHFAKRRSGKSRVQKQKRREKASAELKHQLPGSELRIVQDLLRPHLESEHVKEPNMLVGYLRDGVTAIHLYSGRQVAKMSLKPATLHADINADGLVDHVEAIAGWVTPWYSEIFAAATFQKHIPKSLPRCLALVTTGIPPQKRLLNTTICPKEKGKRGRNRRSYRFTSEDKEELTVTRPAILLRASNKRKPSRGGNKYDVVFATSTGHVTSVAPDGSRNWQIRTDATWTSPSAISARLSRLATKEGQAEAEILISAFMPTATPLSTRHQGKGGIPENVIIIGESTMSLVSRGGSIRADVDLPGIPIAPPILGDFSGDGYTDLIIWTPDGIYGYLLRRRVATHLFTILMAILIVALAFALVFVNLDSHL